ncbi:hypothetical protein BMH32_01185 [Leucobacter sp. OLJS4]|uniref:hypothetical protein n=1 Tax=Leucobacter sp. OLJS4 TaxID=1914922 RepID=UPI000C186A4C|nr:hypothetical protein [Leucobacter sp. OLJS4]PIJ13938.1 hypothetical protein BMH32_01185 [Leucobacter sp. OLJS4]
MRSRSPSAVRYRLVSRSISTLPPPSNGTETVLSGCTSGLPIAPVHGSPIFRAASMVSSVAARSLSIDAFGSPEPWKVMSTQLVRSLRIRLTPC